MSYHLWRFFLEDDVESFRQYLSNATYTFGPARTSTSGPLGSGSFKIGSPGSLSTSPRTPLKSRKSSGNTHLTVNASRDAGAVITRADVNAKDAFGRTILHHAASSTSANALEFVKALLEVPFIDLYAQDLESGWTPLHRALYFGNVSIAQALMRRDVQDATDFTSLSHAHAGGLVKIKDHEGSSPFEIFGLTIAQRTLPSNVSVQSIGMGDDESTNSVDLNEENSDRDKHKGHVRPCVDLQGDEVFAFGSNKNFSLGLGDEDDRHFPERLQLRRPEHLLVRLYEDHLAETQKSTVYQDLVGSSSSLLPEDELPALIRYKPISIQDVVMSKLHTAVLTNDPISNLYVCGFGPGGRLGTGDEATSFTYKCIQGGGLAKRRIVAVALGQDHTIAVCSQGEVFSWGSNRYGQLGYALPEVSAKEIPMQLLPRQLYGYIKKELIIGAAASAIHSAVYTATGIYTFGKNEGQLGLMDADARSLETQIIPRRIGVSVLQSGILSVSAIDRATTVLLENHDVIVFTHYGWTKVPFPLEGFTNYFLPEALATRYNHEINRIQKITSGGNTICAMSSLGEAFTVEVPRPSEVVPSNVSTTNPTKARNALPQPTNVWFIKKDHMAAIDVAVGQDGSVILCTKSGSVWRKEKRANIKSVRNKNPTSARARDYKFVRIPNLTRAIAVRSNAFGAFTAVRKDCSVTRDQIVVNSPTLWSDLFPLISFHDYGELPGNEDFETNRPRFWTPSSVDQSPALIKRAIITSSKCEEDLLRICGNHAPLSRSGYDVWITSNVTDVRIPVHSFLVKARSKVMRRALAEFHETYYYSLPDIMSIEYGQDGQIQIQFPGADFLTIANLVFYLYTDNVIDVWHFTSKALQSAARYRSVRTELMKIATHLQLRQLERAVRVMIDPIKAMNNDMEMAITDLDFFTGADVLIQLADGVEVPAHSALLCIRCPFFDGLFNGHAGGIWISSRRVAAEDAAEAIQVDLKHIDAKVFQMVLRHIYADTGEQLFDAVVTKSFDEFVDFVIEVMSAANELMLERLAQVCQKTLGNFVTTRNICQLLNIVSECSVDDFKHVGLEYVCLNMESILEHRLLDDLDTDLLTDLDRIVQENQIGYMPFARSDRAQADLLERHPDLADGIHRARQRRIDSMRLRSRLVEDEERYGSANKLRVGSYDRTGTSPLTQRHVPSPTSEEPSPSPSPAIAAKEGIDDLPFEMDEDRALPPSPSITEQGRHTDEEQLAGSSMRLPASSRPSRSQNLGTGEADPPTSLRRETPQSPFRLPVSNFELPKEAWRSSPQASKKTDLKDIMSQASATRVSHLSQAMKKVSAGSVKPVQKMSQKERKKQQQESKQQGNDTTSEKPVAQASFTTGPPPSPWQNLPPQNRSNLNLSSPSSIHPEGTARPAARGSMTMRQTVAGESPGSAASRTKPARHVSSPNLASSTTPAPPQIQSIRHSPLPVRSTSVTDAHASMADILSQQQTEKSAVKEAAAKRSLQEIQQEQEFQAWWDNETRRVQEEEAQAKSTAERRGKGGRGRGRGGPRRGGRGASQTAGIEGQDRSAVQQDEDLGSRSGGGRGRGRARARV